MRICIYDNDSLHNVVLFVTIFCNRCCLYCELYNVLCECGKKGISLDRSMAFAFPAHLLQLHVFYFNI